jgi:hypothetical protein
MAVKATTSAAVGIYRTFLPTHLKCHNVNSYAFLFLFLFIINFKSHIYSLAKMKRILGTDI